MARKQLTRLAAAICLTLGVFFLMSCQSQPAATPTTAPKPAAPAAAPAAPTAAAPAAPTAAAPAAAPTSAPAAAATPAETVKIGISASLTGPAARVGITIDRFERMAIDDINAKGGIKVGGKTYKFEAVTVDDKSTAVGGREAADRLVLADKVKFILGHISGPAAGAQAVTEPNKVLIIGSTIQDGSLGPKFPFTLQAGLSHSIMRSNAIYQYVAKEQPQVKRIVQMMTDDPAGRSISDANEVNAKALGITIVAKEFFPGDIKDFGPLVTKVLALKPDAVDTIAGGRGPLFLNMMKTLSEQGFQGETIATSADITAMNQGIAFINKFTTATMADWKSPAVGDMEKQIIQRGIDKWGEANLELFQNVNYNIVLVLAQAMEKAGTVDDTAKLAQVIREGQWDTIYSAKWGKAKFVGQKTFGIPVAMEQPVYVTRQDQGKITTPTAIMGTLP